MGQLIRKSLAKKFCRWKEWKLFFSLQMASQGQSWQKDAADQNFDYMFKLLIIGNSSVGKTSFLFRWLEQGCQMVYFKTKKIPILVLFWRASELKILVYFTVIWYNLCPFGIIYGRLI
jgi:hypothetical protein